MYTYDEKIRKIQRLLEQKAHIDGELKKLLEAHQETTSSTQISTPIGFSMADAVFNVITEAGQVGVETLNIMRILATKYSNAGITREKVASSIAYLKNTKHLIESAGRSRYKLVQKENPITIA